MFNECASFSQAGLHPTQNARVRERLRLGGCCQRLYFSAEGGIAQLRRRPGIQAEPDQSIDDLPQQLVALVIVGLVNESDQGRSGRHPWPTFRICKLATELLICCLSVVLKGLPMLFVKSPKIRK